MSNIPSCAVILQMRIKQEDLDIRQTGSSKGNRTVASSGFHLSKAIATSKLASWNIFMYKEMGS